MAEPLQSQVAIFHSHELKEPHKPLTHWRVNPPSIHLVQVQSLSYKAHCQKCCQELKISWWVYTSLGVNTLFAPQDIGVVHSNSQARWTSRHPTCECIFMSSTILLQIDILLANKFEKALLGNKTMLVQGRTTESSHKFNVSSTK